MPRLHIEGGGCVRFLLAITLCLSWASAFAQLTTTSSLSGAVTDPQGAAVPGAQITVVNPLNGRRFTTTSGSRGEWTVPSLPTAVYEATISAQGFKTRNRPISRSIQAYPRP